SRESRHRRRNDSPVDRPRGRRRSHRRLEPRALCGGEGCVIVEVAGRATYAYTASRTFDRARPTIVFVHGAANDHSVWALQSHYFAHHGFNALAVDLPAHGRSDGTPLASVEALADWLLAFLDSVGAVRAALVGHSLGALTVLEAAARAPSRVVHLALV